MVRIDAHQHFWRYQPARDAWITEDMAVIRRDFLPADLAPLLRQHGFDGCVAVQADQSATETTFLLELAARHEFIRGVVGWVDLQAPDVAEQLAAYRPHAKLKGFRHVLQSETDRGLMLTPAFRRGLAALQRQGFSYDLLVFPDQLAYCRQLVEAFPELPFVLDHLGKPYIRQGELAAWAYDVRSLAALPNVSCKVSGLVTEADWRQWQPADFRPYLDVVFEAFGPQRVMFGSDWPVCQLAGTYTEVMAVAQRYLTSFSAAEQRQFWGENAARFYRL
ncbi:amidohydrolase family protein [Solirubrum puertoriconensis]|uniref:Amidohydrolase n=1 Tax=Solirubrum puertoriconensis TaxID=1751427 RepID=A0A9X0L5V0_SOLP1|nr:amidohydrolase family protein [Solirubrum puertoriconensis]KUG09143.1 amidohydrolase [Solirubrum puertoriconensis]